MKSEWATEYTAAESSCLESWRTDKKKQSLCMRRYLFINLLHMVHARVCVCVCNVRKFFS